MRSFSILTVLSALAASVAAYTTPTTGPEGNPIGSPLENEQVPVGKPYNIVWTPDAPGVGTVTLVLLRGPSTNVQPLYPIVEKTPNTGSYIWTPATDLESDTTHYALQLIEDATGRFQWGMQFGIENPDIPKGGVPTTTETDDDAVTTTVTATSTSTAVVTVTGTKPAETETETETETATSTVEETTTTKASNLTVTLITSTTKAAVTTTEIETTTVASNATTSATQPAVPTKSGDEEGAASKMGASIAIVAVAAAAFAFF